MRLWVFGASGLGLARGWGLEVQGFRVWVFRLFRDSGFGTVGGRSPFLENIVVEGLCTDEHEHGCAVKYRCESLFSC